MSKRDIKFAQHYVECTQCENNAEYFCNTCTDNLCQLCRDRHTKSKATRSHIIVPYQGQQETLQETEICTIHPELTYEMTCRECQLPVCIRCMKEDHKGHTFKNIEDALNDFEEYNKENIERIKKKISMWRKRLVNLSNDKDNSKQILSEIRTRMQEDAMKIKMFVDKILEKNLEDLDREEIGLIDDFENEISSVSSYIRRFENLIDTARQSPYRKLRMLKEILQFDIEPDQQTPQIPSYQSKMIFEEDVTKLLGNLSARRSSIKKMNQHKPRSTLVKNYHIGSPIKCNEFKSPVDESCHISFMPPDKVLIGNQDGKMVLTDKNGNKLNEIKARGELLKGFHTISKDGYILFVDRDQTDNSIKKYSLDGRTTKLINTGLCTPISVYSSAQNGDILVGMSFNRSGRVSRYSKEGNQLWQSQSDVKGHNLYKFPRYITENVNGDTCTSDGGTNGVVVVVDKEGNHRFSYDGPPGRSNFRAYGICTDIQGHILVIDGQYKVHLIDQNGKFIMILLTSDHGISGAYGLCSGADNNLWVCGEKTVKEFKYLYF